MDASFTESKKGEEELIGDEEDMGRRRAPRHTLSGCARVLKCLESLLSPCCSKSLTIGTRTVSVKRVVAEGGYSSVYLVEEGRRPLALKVMTLGDAEQTARARFEADVHMEFDHPNLLPLEARAFINTPSGVEARLLFQYFPRGTLQDALERLAISSHSFSERECRRYFHGICSGVRALHHHHPVWAHRDLKPHNVLLSGDGIPVVMDFGSVGPARLPITTRFEALQLQEFAQAHCSMPYRAPELYDVPTGATITEKTDIWSLGCLLYTMAFGISPFEVEYLSNGTSRVVECTHLRVLSQVAFPRKHAFSPDFIELIQWLLQQNAERRPSIDEVLHRLETSGSSQDAK